jgi:uncharacterized protein (DUF1499 family)
MFSGSPPRDLGIHDGRLKPCPDSPNCVSSQAQGRAYITPLLFEDSPHAAFLRLKSIVGSMPRVRIVESSPQYLRAEAASRVFGFVDDIEFHLDAAARLVHARSAARLGYRDFGVNRKRIEAIRARFMQSAAAR